MIWLPEKEGRNTIRVVNKNTSSQLPTEELYTTKQAYEALINSDTVHYNKVLLQRCNLNNYITPNLTYDASKSEVAKQDLLSDYHGQRLRYERTKIIDRGEIIDQHTYDILRSLQKEWSKRSETAAEKD